LNDSSLQRQNFNTSGWKPAKFFADRLSSSNIGTNYGGDWDVDLGSPDRLGDFSTSACFLTAKQLLIHSFLRKFESYE